VTRGGERLYATSSVRIRPLLPAFLLGLAFAVAATAGSALLLYTTQGFLRAAGLLIALALGALTAGAWVASSDGGQGRGRWLFALLAYTTAWLAVAAWTRVPEVREWGAGNALAMLLILAVPAYASGLLLGGFFAAGRPAAARLR
jgi:hypothetical protein